MSEKCRLPLIQVELDEDIIWDAAALPDQCKGCIEQMLERHSIQSRLAHLAVGEVRLPAGENYRVGIWADESKLRILYVQKANAVRAFDTAKEAFLCNFTGRPFQRVQPDTDYL